MRLGDEAILGSRLAQASIAPAIMPHWPADEYGPEH